jgi:tetratricopeptide (TPR) repeat protein
MKMLENFNSLRQEDESAARGAFVRAIGQADEILSKTAEYYDALDAKGLALVGAGLLEIKDNSLGKTSLDNETLDSEERPARTNEIMLEIKSNPLGKTSLDNKTLDSEERPARTPAFEQAIECFRKAREIAPHAGVVKSVLRLFDELAKCDEAGALKGIREVIDAKPLVE